MDAKELRIGNWLYSNLTMQQFQVISEDIHEIFIDPRTTEPVPLTEEWLVKFGFEYDEKFGGVIVKNRLYNDTICIQLSPKTGRVIKCKIYLSLSTKFDKVQYVHQLQNLYYALTGEELTLKP
jgi:hypothetical protein